MDLRALFLSVIALLLCGCSAERSLSRPQINSIPDLEVVVGVAQETLAVQDIEPFPMPTLPSQSSPSYSSSSYHHGRRNNYSNSSSSSDAALGAAIGEAVVLLIAGAISARQENRRMAIQARAAPLKQALDGYDFRAELLQATTDALSGVRSVKVNVQPAVLTNTYELPVRWAHDRSTASAVLFFFVSYSFDEGRGGYGLTFKSQALIFPKTAHLKALRRRPNEADPIAEGNAIHLKKVEYFLPYDGGPNIREVLKLGAQALAGYLAADLEPAK